MHYGWLKKRNTKAEEDERDLIPITLLQGIIIHFCKYDE